MKFKCKDCGKFLGSKDKEAVMYISYGHCGDLEPPDPEYICGKCYVDYDKKRSELLYDISWRKPVRIYE